MVLLLISLPLGACGESAPDDYTMFINVFFWEEEIHP